MSERRYVYRLVVDTWPTEDGPPVHRSGPGILGDHRGMRSQPNMRGTVSVSAPGGFPPMTS